MSEETPKNVSHRRKKKEERREKKDKKNTPPISPKGGVVAKTWRTDFPTYLNEARQAFKDLKYDAEWISQRKNFHPGLDIVKTLEKAFVDFWAKEGGWANKKKRRSTVKIDWKSTANSALSKRDNQVWLEREFNNSKRTFESKPETITEEEAKKRGLL